MCTRCAMMASSVTPLVEEERVEVDGAVETEGVAVCVWGCLGLNYAVLCRMVTASMAHIYERWGDLRYETKKWQRSLVIA